MISHSIAESQWKPGPGMAPMVGTSRSKIMFLMRLVSSKYWCWKRSFGSLEYSSQPLGSDSVIHALPMWVKMMISFSQSSESTRVSWLAARCDMPLCCMGPFRVFQVTCRMPSSR